MIVTVLPQKFFLKAISKAILLNGNQISRPAQNPQQLPNSLKIKMQKPHNNL